MTTEHLSDKAEPTETTAAPAPASGSSSGTASATAAGAAVPADTADATGAAPAPAAELSAPPQSPAELPSAKVGVMEVEGVQIEMFSLAKLREQNLALEQAQAAAKAAQKEQRKAQRKRKESSVDDQGQPKPKRKRKAKAAAVAKAAPADGGTSPAPVPEPALDLDNATVATAPTPEPSAPAAAVSAAEPAQAPAPAAAPEPTAQDSAAAPPSVAQSLLQSLISNVEQLEQQASHVTDEEVAQAAAEETEALQHAQESTAVDEGVALNSSGTAAGFPEPEWADMDELTPEQLEQFSHMGLTEGDICPLCSNGLLIMRHSYKADFLGCSNFPHCKFHLFTGKRSAVVTLKELSSTCPECHGQLEVKKGRFGIFIGCSNYPACTYVYRRQDETPLVQVACPVCHQGHLVERRGRSGKTFYGCDNFPKCSYSVFGPPVQQACEECGFPVMYKKKTKKGFVLVCGDPKCASHRKKAKPQLMSDS